MAVALAKAVEAAGAGAVVINADASQVYADLAILSARPTVGDMAGVPHRLFGHIDGATAYSAALWADEARAEIRRARDDGRIPILVGGTGLYIGTLLNGIAPLPPIEDSVRAMIRALPVAEAYARLQTADPHAAARLKPQDKTRIARALEVVTGSGTPMHIWQRQRIGGIATTFDIIPAILLPPREWLRERCNTRLATMFVSGAADEVAALLARNLDPNLPVMRAIGVPQIQAWLRGECTETEALSAAQAATRQYAKRQFTWFRHQLPAEWSRHEESLNIDSINKIAIMLRDRLLTG